MPGILEEIREELRAVREQQATILDLLAEMTPSESNLSVKRVAGMLGVSADSVRKLIAHGELASVRVGSRVLVPLVSAKQYMAKQGEASRAS